MGDTMGRRPRAPAGGAPARRTATVAKVTMPQLGESVAEGTIGKWLKQPGDHVAKYEPLVEVVTDKVNAEVPSPFEGILREILVEEGATVPNNAEIAVIETADDGPAGAEASAATGPVTTSTPAPAAAEAAPAEPRRPPAATPEPPAPAPAVATGPAGSDERAPNEMAAAASAAPVATAAAAAPAAGADPDARMTPAVRRLLREHDLSAAQIVGTGGGGRITRDDVLKVVEAMRTGAAAPAPVAAAQTNGSAAPAGSAPIRPGRATCTGAAGPGGRPDRVPGRRRRSPAADDPDAQGHRGADDPRPGRAPRLRPHGGRRDARSSAPARRPSATTRPARGSRSATSRS